MHESRPLTDRQLRALFGNLNPARISNRNQGGRNLSYLEAWDVRAALIKVFGFGGFSADVLEYTVHNIADVPRSTGTGTNFRVTASARLRLYIPQLDATYTEVAAASQTGPDLGEVMDFAIKTAESDALKRAAMNLGTQFGLSLYNDGSTSDVVRVGLAPGQEWPRVEAQAPAEAPVTPAPAPQAEPSIEQAEALINGAFSTGPSGAPE